MKKSDSDEISSHFSSIPTESGPVLCGMMSMGFVAFHSGLFCSR